MRRLSHLAVGALVLGCCSLTACGQQLIEFPLPNKVTSDPPKVVSTSPASDATAVLSTSRVTATFNKTMDAATIDRVTFTVSQAGAPVSGSVTLDNANGIATFTPDAEFLPSRLYTATVTVGAHDMGGRALEADYVWSFTTAHPVVGVTAVTAQGVPAPDYVLALDGLTIRTDVHAIVSSATGEAVLTAGRVTGQRYVLLAGGGLRTYAELDGAYSARADAALTLRLAAGDFALVGADLTTPQVRTLIIANSSGGVSSYQAFEITFRPAG